MVDYSQKMTLFSCIFRANLSLFLPPSLKKWTQCWTPLIPPRDLPARPPTSSLQSFVVRLLNSTLPMCVSSGLAGGVQRGWCAVLRPSTCSTSVVLRFVCCFSLTGVILFNKCFRPRVSLPQLLLLYFQQEFGSPEDIAGDCDAGSKVFTVSRFERELTFVRPSSS